MIANDSFISAPLTIRNEPILRSRSADNPIGFDERVRIDEHLTALIYRPRQHFKHRAELRRISLR